ncbi:hypothetical protein LSTR_LSTR016117, partial [Laodelphax striatellus]
LANHVVPCKEVPPPDCKCLYQIQKAILGCGKNPGCTKLPHLECCGFYQIADHVYQRAGCPVKGGGCLKKEICENKNCEDFKR